MGKSIKVLYRGGAATSYFGYPVEVFVDQIEASFGDFILESDQARVSKTLREATEAKADVELQFHLIRHDHSVSLVRVVGSYLFFQEEEPTYLFLLSDEKRDTVPFDLRRERFRLSFSVGTGSLVEGNLQGRIAFLVHEFTNIYEAITIFVSRYVHPQDSKAFAPFADQNALTSSAASKAEQKDIAFRRRSYNEAFQGYRWSLLSYSMQEVDSALVCTMILQDSNKIASQLAEKTLETQLDPLTGVLNRSALEAQVAQQIVLSSNKESLGAFFMLDLDQFKAVNNTFGHDRGDEVLRKVAQAVVGVFRPTDIVARPGGDEFAVFITGIPSYELALMKAENLCNALRTLRLSQEKLQLSCSVGISIFPDHGTSFKELYRTADLALYQAKREGRDRFCLYGKRPLPYGAEWQVDRQWLFSQMEEEIYLCNVGTYALIFANEALLKRLGHTTLTATGHCYEVLHGRSSPCKDCKNLYLRKDKMKTWIRSDTGSDTLFLVREKALLLKGEHVKLSVSTPLPEVLKNFLDENIRSPVLEQLQQW